MAGGRHRGPRRFPSPGPARLPPGSPGERRRKRLCPPRAREAARPLPHARRPEEDVAPGGGAGAGPVPLAPNRPQPGAQRFLSWTLQRMTKAELNLHNLFLCFGLSLPSPIYVSTPPLSRGCKRAVLDAFSF